MKKAALYFELLFLGVLLFCQYACRQKNTGPTKELIGEMNLKRGDVVTCGPGEQQFGEVQFKIAGDGRLQDDFNLGLKLLHSFEYEEAEKVFARIIDAEPNCTMAYWGVAMSNFHPLWAPPTEPELRKGAKAIEIAASIPKSQREEEFINAIASYYRNWQTVGHVDRCTRFENEMEKLHANRPKDQEAAVFYALALNAAAIPTDKSFKKQRKAASILNALYSKYPEHPGIVHYIIHTYDYPELANLGLDAARRYASVAPSSSHALHMPSHIFTRLGLWSESVNSNLASVASSQCYADSAGINGHWDEELHGMDYLMYSYLQQGNNHLAKMQLDYLRTIKKVSPVNFKVAYAFAAIPSRYVLENKFWDQAARLELDSANFRWRDYPWQKAIIHFTRLMGSAHLNKLSSARAELRELRQLHRILADQKDLYKAAQVEVQLRTGEAWIRFKEGKNAEALQLMSSAAQLEDQTEKHPVTPGEVLPARELMGDLYMQMNKWGDALKQYEDDLKKRPNRLNALYGAGLSAEKSGDLIKARHYYSLLLQSTGMDKPTRPEIFRIRKLLDNAQLTTSN